MKVVSWDGNNINDETNYKAGLRPGLEYGLPAVRPQAVERFGSWPLLSGLQRPAMSFFVQIQIAGAAVDTLRDQLLRWFDPEDETPKELVIADDDGSRPRYVEALCADIRPRVEGIALSNLFMATLVVHGDVRPRSTSETSDSWGITASGQTNVVANGGTDETYPTFEITPTSNKTGGLAYKHFIPVVWRSDNAGGRFPTRLGPLDTATLVGGGKMQADGDDLRIYVDGLEVDRWLVDMNTANTYIWVNLNFQPQGTATLGTAIAASGSIDSIDVGEDVGDFPASGMVFIDDEVFVYTGRDLTAGTLTGITRETKGSTMGAHTVGDTVYWLQHEVQIAYGNATLSAPTVDDDYKPMFSLAAADSSNTQWKYTEFGDGNGKRAGRWSPTGNITLAGNGGAYTATQRTLADPYTVAGVWLGTLHGNAYGWQLYHPCGIVNADWADGYKRAEDKDKFVVHLMYWVRGNNWWTWQATLANPTLDNTWQAWSQAAGAAWSAANLLSIAAYFQASDVEAGTVTVSLNSSETPLVDMTACSEQGNYPLAATITNQTTGEAITVTLDMELNEKLVVNTDEETVTYDADDSPQFQAVEVDSVRKHWLKLLPGNNTLRFDDTGTAGVTFVTKFRARYY